MSMALFTMSVNAQDKSLSVVVGVNPGIGKLSTSLSHGKEEDHDINYKMGFGVSVDIEKQLSGVITLSEFRYGKWKYDSRKMSTDTPMFPMPAHCDDVTSYSFMQYAGRTFFPKKRLQIPVYIGIGADYLSGKPYHNLFVDLGVKARVKFYVTDVVGIFAGADWTYGFGLSSRGMPSSDTHQEYMSLSYTRPYVDFGATVNF